MKIKYRSGFAEGGFLDDGANIDPVSGNEVPTGSLAEEVRDDIPAQLSEGEFVVPADVVRFIGLDKLMKMREAAKAGLASMEAEGQMGGSPAPVEEMPMMESSEVDIDLMIDGMEDEGAMPAFAEGGFVQREDGSWGYASEVEEEEGSSYSDLMGNNFGSVPTTDTMTYVNADGHKIYIPVIEGKPAYAPPEGYTEVVVGDTTPIVEDPIEEDPVAALAAAAEEGDTRSRDYVQSGQYAGDVSRSNTIRTDRLSALEGMGEANMSQEQVDAMYGALTPQARAVYDKRFRNPKMLDKYMAEGMTAVDLLVMAQKTADTQNRNAGTTEAGSGFTSDGKPIDWSKAAKYIAAGLTVGPMGLIGAAKMDMTEEEQKEAVSILSVIGGAIKGLGEDDEGFGKNANTPVEVTPKVYDQSYWQKYKNKDGTVATSADKIAEMRRIEKETGLNAYGNKIYKEPGSRTVWDDIEEVKINKREAAAVHAKVAAEAATAEAAEVAMQKEMDTLRAEAEAKEAEESRLAAKQAENKREAKANADKIAADRAAYLRIEAKATADRKAREALARQTAIDNANKNNNNDNDNSSSQPKAYKQYSQKAAKAKEAAKSGTGYAGGQYGLAKGGLVGKEPIKKMRSDNTTGLAAKKKSKAKAQAKKGALAAKRT